MNTISTANRHRTLVVGALVLGTALILAATGPTLLDKRGFMPHGFCITWQPSLLAAHVVSDVLIGLAYTSIPLTLLWFVRRRADLPYSWMFLLFGLFIVSCGMTHFVEVLTVWQPYYWFSAAVKIVTATASIGTAIALITLVKPALALPSPSELRRLTADLTQEVTARKNAEALLKNANTSLEERVFERTRELAVANERLAQRQALFDSVLSSVHDYVYVFDRQARFTYANQALLKLWGLDAETAFGRTMTDLNYPATTEAQLLVDLQQVLKTRRVVTSVTHYRSPGGTDGYYENVLSPVPSPTGEIELVAGVSRDITERKQAERAQQEADRRKDEFLATLAHELRNPLAPIRNSLQVLKLSGAAGHLHEIIERQVNHMVRLVDDLMDVSRISRGVIELRKIPLKLRSVLDNALETGRPLIEQKQQTLSVDVQDESLAVEGDAVRLSQALSNLLINAAKYTPDGGSIRLAVLRDGGHAIISVRDSGIGIEAEMLPRVFDMFAQINRGLNDRQQGLGIGLSLTRRLVEMHGGRIEARSEGAGRGSEFIVCLPLAASQADLPLPDGDGVAIGPLRVLVVDDNVDSAETLGTLLRFLGADSHVAHDGPGALAALEVHRPAVVLLDLGMPGMDGYEVVRRIRKDSRFDDVTLIAVTGWGDDEARRRTAEVGFDYHFVKPLDIAALQAALRGGFG